jgi:type I restriction enzyme, S subunit
MKRYETYKKSNLQWVKKIPQHWIEGKVKYLFEIGRGRVISQQELNPEGKYPVFSSQTKNNGCLGYIDTYDFDDNILTWTTDGANAGEVFKRNGKFNCTNVCGTLKPKKVLNLDYFLYLMKFLTPFYKRPDTNGAKIMNGEMAEIISYFPTLPEQTQIAAYLDYKTGLIDAIIAQKEELIKKLKEQRQAIINEAVTKGLNPGVKLKDSGIEWLGDIPEHWEVIKLFGLCYLVRGNSSFKKDELLSNGTYVALQYGKTYKVNEVNEKYKFYVNDEFYKESQIVNYGDTIIISTSETIEDLGHSVFYNRKDLGLLGGEQLLLKAKNNKINPKYLFYSTKVFLKDLRKNATGVKVYRFNIHDLKNVFTPVPSILEQNLIVKHIETKSTTIDKVIIRSQTSIQKLKEYRQSLISEAVTGKIDVRDWQAPKS